MNTNTAHNNDGGDELERASLLSYSSVNPSSATLNSASISLIYPLDSPRASNPHQNSSNAYAH